MLKRRPVRATALLFALALPACQITWREPVLQPLNSNRYYDTNLETTCDAAQKVVMNLGLTVKESQAQERACLLETDFKVLSDSGDDPTEHLDRIAFVGVGPFIGGRYALTVTTRDVRDSGTRVKVTTRVEGYISQEFGYQVLRSRGIIEDRVFAAIGESVGVAPVEAN